MKIYKKVNAAYKLWKEFPNDTHMSNVLSLVREMVMARFLWTEPDADDIAQNTLMTIWRSMIGDLKPHDPARGEFAQYVVVTSLNEAKKFHRSDRLVPVTDDFLEQLQQNAHVKPPEATDPVEFAK